MIRNILLKFLLAIICTLVIFTGLFATLPGLKITTMVLQTFIPGHLKIGKLEGNLLGPIIIKDLHYRNYKFDIVIHQFELRWQPKQLWEKRLLIEKISMDSLNVTLIGPHGLPKLPSLPRNVILQSATIKHFKLVDEKTQLLNIDDVRLRSEKHMAEDKRAYFYNLRGIMSHQPLSGKLHLHINNGLWLIHNTHLQLGRALLEIDGSFGKVWNLNWDLRTPEPIHLSPDISGALNSQGKVTGPLQTPIIKATLQANDIHYRNFRIDNLNVHSNLDLNPQGQNQLSLNGDEINLGHYVINQFTLELQGNLSKHQLRGSFQDENNRLSLQLNGQLLNKTWQALITQLSLTNDDHTLRFSSGNIKILRNKLNLNSSLQLNMGNNQNIIANLALPKFFDNTIAKKSQPLQGDARMQFHQFNLLSSLFPSLKNVSGRLNANFNITGTVAAPKLSGTAALENASATIPKVGVTLKAINITATGNPTGDLTIRGQARSGNGLFQLHGNAHLAQLKPQLNLNVSGNNVEIANTKSYQIIASPDLVIQMQGTNMHISGETFIPRALFRFKKLGGDVPELSSDIVFIEASKDDESKAQHVLNISAKIHIELGDNVIVDRTDLTGKLAGALDIIYAPPAPTVANGEVHIVNGKYNAYGKILTVREGYFNFAGSPLDNPNLNLRAVRTVTTTQGPTTATANLARSQFLPTNINAGMASTQVVVGINVTGPLKHYQAKLFSEPPLYDQSDTLALLLLGKTANSLSSGGTQTLLQAATSLNLGGGQINSVVQQLQQNLGLSELTIEDAIIPGALSTTQTTSLVIGKQFYDRIFFSYSIGLLQPISVFKIRYVLNQNWSVQSVSSTLGSGIDLVYSVEK